MTWHPAWKKLPSKNGIYLCQIDDHYGIFLFKDGIFHPNDWSEFVGVSENSHFIGGRDNILHWMELPEFEELSLIDLKEVRDLRRLNKKLQKKCLKELVK